MISSIDQTLSKIPASIAGVILSDDESGRNCNAGNGAQQHAQGFPSS
jgi:hypothetical protein